VKYLDPSPGCHVICGGAGDAGSRRIAKPVAQALLEFFVFGMRHQCLLEGASCFISAR
jgi:hypothetical protein